MNIVKSNKTNMRKWIGSSPMPDTRDDATLLDDWTRFVRRRQEADPGKSSAQMTVVLVDLLRVIELARKGLLDEYEALAKRAEAAEETIKDLVIQLRDAIAWFKEGNKTIHNGEVLYDAWQIRESYINNNWRKAADEALAALNAKEPESEGAENHADAMRRARDILEVATDDEVLEFIRATLNGENFDKLDAKETA